MPDWKSSSPPPAVQLKLYSKWIGGDSFIEYDQNKDLAELVKGRRLAYVGPAPNIQGNKLGSLIDSCDLVVRAGQLTPILDNLKEDYGARTDIIVHSFNQWEQKIVFKNLDFLKASKYLICSMVCCGDKGASDEFLDFITRKGMLIHKPEDRYLFKLFNDVGTTINSGFAGLLILLNYDIQSIYLTGMDFYNMANYGNVYREDYYDTVVSHAGPYFPKNRWRHASARDVRADLHDQRSQILYLKDLIKREKRIILDEYLTENLEKYQ